MHQSSRGRWIRLGLSSVLLSSTLLSNELWAAEPVLAPEAPASAGAGTAPADRHAAAVLQRLGEQQRNERIIGAWISVALGAAATGTGLLVDAKYDQSYGQPLWIVGLGSVGGGLLGLVLRRPLERLADEWRSDPSAGLQAAWRTKAQEARSARKFVGVFNLVLGGIGFVGGAVMVLGASDTSHADKAEWATLGFLGGTLFTSLGIAGLTIESEFEQGYDLAYPTTARSAAPVQLGFAPRPGGGALQLGGAF